MGHTTTHYPKMSAREELRRQRRASKLSKTTVALADNTLADLQKVFSRSGQDSKTEQITTNRNLLNKENQRLTTEESKTIGTSVPVGVTSIDSPREHLENKLKHQNTPGDNNTQPTSSTSSSSSLRPSSVGVEYQLNDANTSFASKQQDQTPGANCSLPGYSPWSNNDQTETPTTLVQINQFKQKRRKKSTNSKPTRTTKTTQSTKTKPKATLKPPSTTTQPKPGARTTNRDPWAQFSKPKKNTKEDVISKWRSQIETQANGKPLGADGPELVVRVICAEDVLAKDRLTGKSDPVAFVFCGKESKISAIKTGTCNPYWNAEFRFGGAMQNIRDLDELHVQIKDDDGVSKEVGQVRGRTRPTKTVKMKRLYDNLGGITVDLKELRGSKTKWSKPKWYTLQPLKGMSVVRGRVRMSLRYVGLTNEVGAERGGAREEKYGGNVDERGEKDEEDVLMRRSQYGNGGDESVPMNIERQSNKKASPPKYLERKVEQLSSFRAKTRAELKSMAQQLEQQSLQLEQARSVAETAQQDAKAHQEQCENKGAKIQELAHTIETLQRTAATTTTGTATGTTTLATSKRKPQQRLLPPPTATSHKVRFEDTVNRDKTTGLHGSHGLQFEDQHEFTLSVANALNRLRDPSTRPAGHVALGRIADGLTPAKSRVLWRCLRSGEQDGDVNYQRESASVFGTFAERAPRACATTLGTAMEGIARRIVSGGNDGGKNNALVLSVGVFALHVFPAALAGKVQPSLMPALRPFCDLIRRYPHALAGAVAARCVRKKKKGDPVLFVVVVE